MKVYKKPMIPIRSQSPTMTNAARYLHLRRNRNGNRQPLASRPLSGVSVPEEEGMSPLPVHCVKPCDSTQELLEFLQTTEPPPKSPNQKKSAFSFLKSGIHPSKKPQTSQPAPIALPESVTPRTLTNGKRYLHISLPTEDGASYRSFQAQSSTDSHSLNEQYSFPYRLDSLKSGNSSSAPHITLPESLEEPMPPTRPWVSRRPHLEVNAVDSYHLYLRTQMGDRSNLSGFTRNTNGLKRSLSDGLEESKERNMLRQRENGASADETFQGEQSWCEIRHPRNAISPSNNPSISIHNHESPQRNSSLTKPRLFLPEAHISVEPQVPLGTSNQSNAKALSKATMQKNDCSARPVVYVPMEGASCYATHIAPAKGKLKSLQSSIPGPIPFYSTSTKTPPPPGPAPTKALPSLPLGHQNAIGKSITTIQSSKKVTLLNSSECQGEGTLPPETEGYSAKGPGRDATPKRQKSARRIREERVRERKLRDVQSVRSFHGSISQDDVLSKKINGTVSDEDSLAGRRSSHISTTAANSSNCMEFLRGSARLTFPTSLADRVSSVPKHIPVLKSSFSPIMVVTEQEPALAASSGSSIYSTCDAEERKISQRTYNSDSVSRGHSCSSCQSFSPSDTESTRETLLQRDWTPASARTSTGTESTENLLTISAISTREIGVDARLVALEKKNALLESAIVALLQNSARTTVRAWPTTSTQEVSNGLKSITPDSTPPLELVLQSIGC